VPPFRKNIHAASIYIFTALRTSDLIKLFIYFLYLTGRGWGWPGSILSSHSSLRSYGPWGQHSLQPNGCRWLSRVLRRPEHDSHLLGLFDATVSDVGYFIRKHPLYHKCIRKTTRYTNGHRKVQVRNGQILYWLYWSSLAAASLSDLSSGMYCRVK
jgi:hypothetical protein